jgi:hypothetical protein
MYEVRQQVKVYIFPVFIKLCRGMEVELQKFFTMESDAGEWARS